MSRTRSLEREAATREGSENEEGSSGSPVIKRIEKQRVT